MKHLLYITLLLLTTLSACQPEETNEPQVRILCQNYNAEYFYAHNGDTARCYVPNCFTPNGDGMNEYFSAQGHNILPTGSFIIKNGNIVVYQNDSILRSSYNYGFEGWNGMINGQKSARKNYDYTINGTDVFGNAFTLNGVVSVMDSLGYINVTWNDVKVNCDTCRYGSQWDGFRYDPTLPNNEFFIGPECLE